MTLHPHLSSPIKGEGIVSTSPTTLCSAATTKRGPPMTVLDSRLRGNDMVWGVQRGKAHRQDRRLISHSMDPSVSKRE